MYAYMYIRQICLFTVPNMWNVTSSEGTYCFPHILIFLMVAFIVTGELQTGYTRVYQKVSGLSR
jgi:hypothetical protein